MNDIDPVLELRAVVRSYPGSPPIQALAGVDVSIQSGELVAIVGPSGSGKSTMLNMMGALDRPTTGDVLIEGRSLTELSDRRVSGLRGRRIGFVFQQFHLIAGLSSVENVATGLTYQGTPRRKRREEAAELLGAVGLGDRLRHRPNQLSGGERQRVAIARALLGNPAIVLADEPTGNLDSKTGDGIIDLLRELHRAGSTIVVITHDKELASELPRTVALLDGKISSDTADAVSVL